jgi:hypothetical protein
MELEQISFSLNTVMEDVLELMAENAFSKNLELSYIPEPRLRDKIVGDSGRVRQVGGDSEPLSRKGNTDI